MDNYQSITRELAESTLVSTAAEAQGYICGLLCVLGPTKVKLPKNDQVLVKLLDETRTQLTKDFDASFEFQLLLPDDTSPLEERIVALSEWSQSFLAGLCEGGLTKKNAKSEEIGEILTDFSQIANVHNYEYTDESESDYMELVEYVRIALLTVYTELVLGKKFNKHRNTQ